MIGRERELARFDELLSALRSGGGGGAVLVEGEAGIGKTTLVTAVARTAQDAGFLVLRCQGFEGEAATGFAGLHELLHPALDQVDALPPRQRSALLTALGLQAGPSPDRLLIGLAVLGLLEEAAATRPVLLHVEDAHWLDASTAEAVAFVARRLGAAPVLLVATVRRDPAAPTAQPSTAALEEVAEVLSLGPLDDDDARRLLDSLDPRGTDLGTAGRRRVLDEAHGNPLALREFAAALDGGTALTSGPLPTTRRLERAFLDAVAPLPVPSRTMLLLAATGEDLLVAELLDAAAALGLAPQDLDLLEREGLVDTTGGRARLRHPLVRSAVHGAASSAERFRAHQALAAASHDPGRAAWHRAAAVPDRDEAVAAELEAAGTRAAERGARSEAAAALRRAAELTPDPSRRATRLLSAAQYLRQAGATAEAAATLDTAAALVSAPQERFQVAYLRSMLGIAAGEAPHDTGRFVHEALELDDELAAAGDPGQRVVVLANAAFHAANQATDATWRRAVHDRLAAVDAGPHPLQQLALAVVDPRAHPDVRDRLPDLLATFADEPYMLLALGQVAERLQDLPIAQAAWSRAVEAFHRAGSPGDEGQALNGLASVRVARGQLTEALQDAENAHRTGVDVGMAMVAASASATAARALALTGRTAEAAEALARVRAAGPADAVPQVPAGASWAAGLVALQEGRSGDALAHLLDVGTYPLFAAWSVADLAEAAAGAGTPTQALPALERVAPEAELFGSDHLRLLVHRARALLAGSGAEEHFLAALAAGERADAPVELARTQLAYGQWLRREQRPVDARPVLAAAVGGFERRGARALAERAAQELRAAGGAVRAGDVRPGSGAPLTAQELQIARLAAQGMSNKEIADRLYLSHRTVGAHLYKLFPKVGITSRARLRTALADLDLLGPAAG
ncbi:helix-turn-helix transcriptional regulator [Kineococcus rhizosphaerae]|uniref:Regulatory LuxR family protein n=1 Tax=Kineococcus rhizosphaerae TaxID=559628 RepID=A0A2T0R2U1_9ACTN|nr:AAA family ATPase [Kineococcus rhizosphaerae]PRY14095.1 regulatory LuxR family protein [Kineococcus rhizosphaerae]